MPWDFCEYSVVTSYLALANVSQPNTYCVSIICVISVARLIVPYSVWSQEVQAQAFLHIETVQILHEMGRERFNPAKVVV